MDKFDKSSLAVYSICTIIIINRLVMNQERVTQMRMAGTITGVGQYGYVV